MLVTVCCAVVKVVLKLSGLVMVCASAAGPVLIYWEKLQHQRSTGSQSVGLSTYFIILHTHSHTHTTHNILTLNNNPGALSHETAINQQLVKA